MVTAAMMTKLLVFLSLNALLLTPCASSLLVRSTRMVKRQTSGASYPAYTRVPESSFSCDQYGPGYYADLETGCQVFHVCHTDKVDSFICPPGTVFNQKVFVCDWRYNVDCSLSVQFYSLNSLIGREDVAGQRSDSGRRGRTQPTPPRSPQRIQETPALRPQFLDGSGGSETKPRREDDLSHGRGDLVTQGVTERIDAGDSRGTIQASVGTSVGQEENYESSASSAAGSARQGRVINFGDGTVFDRISGGRDDGLSTWGSVLGNAIAKESRVSSTLSGLSSNFQSHQKMSNNAPSNRIRPNTFIKTKPSSKTSSPSPGVLRGSKVSGRRVSQQPSRATVGAVRSPEPATFTAFQISTSQPFVPTVPPLTRYPDRSASPVSDAPSQTPTPRPKQLDTVPAEISTSSRQHVTSMLQPSTSRPKNSVSTRPRIPTIRPAVSSTVLPQQSPERPESPPTSPSSSGTAGSDLPLPQYHLDRVLAGLAGRLATVESLDMPADRLVTETPPSAPGSLVFSGQSQTQPDWLYALGGLAL